MDHYPFCATCRTPLCALCACGPLHRDHYLISRPRAAPCAGCADAASPAHALEETFPSAVTQALARLQLLLLDCSRGGAHITYTDYVGPTCRKGRRRPAPPSAAASGYYHY
jgi:hypothetical protein